MTSDSEAARKANEPGEVDRPKILARPAPGEAPKHVPARMINEVLYCERLMHLEWVQGEFADNFFTVDGRSVHRRADDPKGALPEPDGEYDPAQIRSLWLASDRLGITAKIDVVDVSADGRVAPIEYKRGKAPDVDEGAYLPERAQLCAHVLLLRDHGYRCEDAYLYFAGDRRRTRIAITDTLIQITLGAAERAREIAEAEEAPPPLDDSPKCNGCSLIGICLPDEVTFLAKAPETELHARELDELFGPLDQDPWGIAGTQAATETTLRRLHPARDDKLPLYVQEPGARIGLSGETLKVQPRKAPVIEAKLPQTSEVSVFGPVQITTQAIHALLREGVPVSYFSTGGWYQGRLVAHDSKNVELRIAQHAAAADPVGALRLARGFVASKILNCRTMLRRNHASPDPVALKELKRLAERARGIESAESLLGIEGTAARLYFGEFTGMFKAPSGEAPAFELDGRNRRPPKDPVNAMLSFVYALLTKELTIACAKVGLEPLLGFYHRPRFGRPALALDLMEEFRPLIADSVVIGAVNNGVLESKDFVSTGVAVSLGDAGRKKILLAYERRIDQLVTHPVFGYRISYRRVLEVQARLLARHLLGEIPAYPEFRTR